VSFLISAYRVVKDVKIKKQKKENSLINRIALNPDKPTGKMPKMPKMR
jgi:hypothetical protein